MDVKVVSSIISPEYIKNYISSLCNIDKIIDCELLQSAIHDTYKIETLKQSYIFKIYQYDYKAISEIMFEIDFVSYLKSKNLNVAYYINKENGNFIFKINALEGIRYAVLTIFANGTEIDYKNEDDAYLYGLKTAEIHETSKNFVPSENVKKININFMLETSIFEIEIFLKKQYPSEVKYFQHYVDLLSTKLININFNNLEKVFCHGDLHGGNVHKYLDQITFFDFDFCGYGLLSYDIAVFRWGCMIGDRNHLWEKFIKGYKAVRKLEDKDLEYSLLFVAIRDLWVMHMYLSRIDTMGKLFIHKNYIQNRIDFFKIIESKF